MVLYSQSQVFSERPRPLIGCSAKIEGEGQHEHRHPSRESCSSSISATRPDDRVKGRVGATTTDREEIHRTYEPSVRLSNVTLEPLWL